MTKETINKILETITLVSQNISRVTSSLIILLFVIFGEVDNVYAENGITILVLLWISLDVIVYFQNKKQKHE